MQVILKYKLLVIVCFNEIINNAIEKKFDFEVLQNIERCLF